MRFGVKVWTASMTLACAAVSATGGERRLSVADYRDRMRGAWIGQMVGVSWGMPTEFKWNDAIVPADRVPAWQSDLPLKWAYNNDDLYVEMTFLKTLEDHGLDVSPRQAGIDFSNSEYALWCANQAGRTNLRKGIAPPDCSHPKFNACPNDIDYQIEADYAGIIAPGCPQEVIRLSHVFGRLVNFGDGVWAGQFIGAMYAEAFFTGDVNALIDAGLAAIPEESDYAKMVMNVRAWHRENPKDWTKTWTRIRDTYSKKFNRELKDSNGGIDARLNGACVVLGLLYGNGDLDRSMELAMRCGWDSDCNPSSVGGVLMCARGAKALPAKYTEKLDPTIRFKNTPYDEKALYAVCETLARKVVVRSGGRVEKDVSGEEWLAIPRKRPVPDPWEPSWKAKPAVGSRFTEEEMASQWFPLKLPNAADVDDPDPTVRVQKTLDALYPGWKTSPNGPDMKPGYREVMETSRGQLYGGLVTHPPSKDKPVVLSRKLKVPEGGPKLHFEVSNAGAVGDFRLIVRVAGIDLVSTIIANPHREEWRGYIRPFDISLEPWAGKTVTVELVNEPYGEWMCESAKWHDIRITASNGDL